VNVSAPTSTSVVVDWDGTVTETDTLALVMEEFGDVAVYRETGREMGRSLTHDEALAASFATVRADLEEVVAWLLEEVRIRPGFSELAREHRPLVVSSGFHELIDPILRRERLELEVLANRLDARDHGWRVVFRERSACAECGEACKRALLPGRDVVYIGDGYSDRCAALAARRVFATGSLALDLEHGGVPYEPFADFHDVIAALRREESGS
jgi:2-hydroxy-3-keto-5-methylthiopentenyl-1-phosphate phosphatase